MHDGIEFEKKGIPAAVICTEPFVTSGVAMSNMKGMPDYNFAVMEHPLGSLDQEELKRRAKKITPEIESILMSQR